MIIRKNKSFEINSLFTDFDWYKEDNYVVDETAMDGKEILEKILLNHPYFDLVFDSNNKIVDILPIEKPIHIPTSEEINLQVRGKISEKHDYAQEIQMLNKGIVNSQDIEYINYQNYRNECIQWGINEKEKYNLI